MTLRRWLIWALTGAAALAGAAALRLVTLTPGADHSICLFRRTVGMPCPSCGLTRAAVALARGDWRAAWLVHPLGPVLAVEAALCWLAWGAVLAGLLRRPSARTVELWILGHVAVLLALWLGRAATGTLPW